MIDDYHGERKIILNENNSRAMSSLWFTINKNDFKESSKFAMFQKTFIGNVAITIYAGRNALVWQ
jgi:hypothetical protein